MSFGKTVLHGVSQSVPENADLPAAANMAAECLTEDLLGKWIYDIEQEEWLPMEYIPFRWDFATDEGFIGYHPLAAVPENTIVFDGFYSVLDRLISDGSPTIQIQLEAANDILADAAVGPAKATGAPGLHNIVPDGTAANAIKTTADRWIKLRVLTAALTGGVLVGFLRCFRGFAAETLSSSSPSSSSSSSASSASSASSSSSAGSSPSSSSAGSSASSASSSSGGSSDSSTGSSSSSLGSSPSSASSASSNEP